MKHEDELPAVEIKTDSKKVAETAESPKQSEVSKSESKAKQTKPSKAFIRPVLLVLGALVLIAGGFAAGVQYQKKQMPMTMQFRRGIRPDGNGGTFGPRGGVRFRTQEQ